jgi:DNA polymerase I
LESTHGWYVPVPADREEAEVVVARFKAVLEDARSEKVGQNIKYDLIVLERLRRAPGRAAVRYHAGALPAATRAAARHGLHGRDRAGLPASEHHELIGPKGKGQKSMRDVPVEQVADYAAEDADITWQLYEAFAPR